MPVSFWKAEDLIPHRYPMVLIDQIESVNLDKSEIVASFTAPKEWIGNWFALEYMAQTSAALAGVFDKSAGLPAGRVGFLLGTRKLHLGISEFVPGVKYFVKAVREYEDGESAAFECEIKQADIDDDTLCCKAVLTAYRPPVV
jgi:predicted hotdog family 3-hydroxylacyl-ACP dehydratase